LCASQPMAHAPHPAPAPVPTSLTSLLPSRSTLKRAAPASPLMASPIKYAAEALFGKAHSGAPPTPPSSPPPSLLLATSVRALDAAAASPPSPPLQSNEQVAMMTEDDDEEEAAEEEEDGFSDLTAGAGETRRRLDFLALSEE